MASTLKGRVDRLEQHLRPSRLAGMQEFRLAEFCEPLAVGTVIPEGARVVADFYEDFCFPDWRGQPGVTFRSGYYRERLATDPTDEGRILPAASDPILLELERAAVAPGTEPPIAAAEKPTAFPDEVMNLYRK